MLWTCWPQSPSTMGTSGVSTSASPQDPTRISSSILGTILGRPFGSRRMGGKSFPILPFGFGVRVASGRSLSLNVEPEVGDALQKQLNLQGRHWTLTVAWLVGTLHPRGPYPILALTGEQGSAKTTIGRQVRSIVDPSEAPLWSPPREDRELVIAARNSHVLGLDNLSRISDWLSDALCRIATGGGYSARELYSDGDEVVYSDRRPIILTSIETVVTRGDLADRALAVTLPRIPEESRLPERVIYERMDRIQPLVLGALLDAMVTGLRRLPSVKLERLPRMADFAEWIVACEPALPWKGGAFLDAYSEARDEMVEIGIEADTVTVALTEFLRADGKWSGRADELLEALNAKRTDGNRPPRGGGPRHHRRWVVVSREQRPC